MDFTNRFGFVKLRDFQVMTNNPVMRQLTSILLCYDGEMNRFNQIYCSLPEWERRIKLAFDQALESRGCQLCYDQLEEKLSEAARFAEDKRLVN